MQEALSRLTLEPGSVLADGKYRILRLLGRGGMGAVYEAEHTVTQKRVAIKWMHPLGAPHAAERLVREAQASARVRHRNAVDIYDVGRDGETVFLVMECLDGEPLTSLLERGGIPMHRVVSLLLPAMRAVAAAHKRGVVHRDIKPDNIFLAEEDGASDVTPKVLDFGISKLDARQAGQIALTRPGSAMGTPRYMSYEQLSGAEDVDGRTDVYAFGVILYEALTGQAPYEAQTFPELVAKIMTTTPVPPSQLRPDIPSTLSRIVMWALSRERAERIESVEALIRELEPFATQHGFRSEMKIEELTSCAEVPRTFAQISGVRDAQAPSGAATPVRKIGSEARSRSVARRAVLGAALGVSLLGAVSALIAATADEVAVPRSAEAVTVRSASAPALALPEPAAPPLPEPAAEEKAPTAEPPSSAASTDPADIAARASIDAGIAVPRAAPSAQARSWAKRKRPIEASATQAPAATPLPAQAPPKLQADAVPTPAPEPPRPAQRTQKPEGFRVEALPSSDQF